MEKLYVSNKNESVRMFKSNLLELFTKVHWSVPLIFYVPVVGYFLYQSFLLPEVTLIKGTGLFLFGLFMWTITEYVLHRFIFHYEPNTEFGQWLHFVFHGVHHDYPNDSNRLVMPPLVSVPLAFFFYFSFSFILGSVLISPVFAGFVLGYLAYDMLHYAIHHANLKGKLWMLLKTHHLKHHFKEPNQGFGVSSPIWDWVIGTGFKNLAKKNESVD